MQTTPPTSDTLRRMALLQLPFQSEVSLPCQTIRQAQLEAHFPYIRQAGEAGVHFLCLQELFTGPYFPPSQDSKWYALAEDPLRGPTISALKPLAKQYQMVIIAPIYEEAMTGLYYNTAVVIDATGDVLGTYRKTHLPQVAGFWEKFFFRPGNQGYPVFKTQHGTIGVAICYDRHFPEPFRALALGGAEIIFNPSATVAGLSESIWFKEQTGHAIANGVFVAANNRVGTEAPWNIGHFYGSSYVVSPTGEILAKASREQGELLITAIDLAQVREARNLWQFFRDRRPETYESLTAL
jgi:beta-ureidopropionase